MMMTVLIKAKDIKVAFNLLVIMMVLNLYVQSQLVMINNHSMLRDMVYLVSYLVFQLQFSNCHSKLWLLQVALDNLVRLHLQTLIVIVQLSMYDLMLISL